MRSAQLTRTTKETDISVFINLDGNGRCDISTGVGFFDHMLTAFAVHGSFDLELRCHGDLDVDGHHTIEDCGIVIGQAFAQMFADKNGIARYGSFYVPMDESLAFCALDISSRPYLVLNGLNCSGMLGGYDTALTQEFLQAFAFNAGITLHINILYGNNAHHMIEAAFKALGHAMNIACSKTKGNVLSTKGVL